MATLTVTGRRLHPRDGFPSALSVLSTAAPGSLYKAIPAIVAPGPPRISSTLVISLSYYPRSSTNGTSGIPLIPSNG
ncbi:hypothetical protein DPMN_106278 [Dreissena polymorpha]|uniref:Uncharacterized protein n=1 Tax=Dreissena polymorpha TaxID=45954 RepID=A0A9D4QJS3_DREPO|nr:hypothetical protein DPMN_106278 [Dreissena polymorpha]